MKTYRNFYIHVSSINPGNKEYQVRVGVGSPGGLPGFDEEETRKFDPKIFEVDEDGTSVDLLELIKSRAITPPQIYLLGAILSDLLLPGKIRDRLRKGLEVTREAEQGLRLRLIVEAPQLEILPWEYLYLEESAAQGLNELNFLALQPDISIIRHGAIDQREPRLLRRDNYLLVAAMASPENQPQLNVEADRNAIEKMIATLGHEKGIGEVTPTWVKDATKNMLFDALREGADIFHFAGHGYFNGESGQIILAKNNNKGSDYFDAPDLAQLLTNKVKLAVLTACESAQASGENPWGGVAQSLVQAGLAAVIASQYRLMDQNAEPMTEELYRGVLAGDTVDEAVSNARRAIRNKSGFANRDWGALVLYLRVEDGVIFPQQSGAADTISVVPRIAPTPLRTQLIGRDDQIAQVQQNLNGGKYHLYGTYGVGKTSLAIELFTRAIKNHSFDDGYMWHRVSEGIDIASVLEWIGAQLGDETVAKATGSTAKVNALRELLAERDNLLIGLDEVNNPALARAVLDAAGGCTVVLNGPVSLGLASQGTEVELTPLSSAQAAELFASLINRPLTDISESDRAEINDICEQMGFLPLSIKLAALKNREGESLATLRTRLNLAPVSLIEGHTEVGLIFATIYDDLQKAPAALRLLMRLVSFPALEAPLEPLRLEEDDLDFFQSKDKLIALGVVSPSGADRLAVHPLLGRLARAKADKQVTKAERDRVFKWLLSYAHEHNGDYAALEREHRNLLSAFDWFDKVQAPQGTISLVLDLFDYLRVRGYWQEAVIRLKQALAFAKQSGSPLDQARLRLSLGIIVGLQGDNTQATREFEQAQTLFEQEKDLNGSGQALYRLSGLNFTQGKLALSRRQCLEALKLMTDDAPARDRAGAHSQLAALMATQGELDNARAEYGESLKISVTSGDLEEQARVHASLGRLLRKAGKPKESLTEYQTAFEQFKSIRHVRDMARLEIEIGYHHYYQGEYDEALPHFDQALSTFRALKYRFGMALVYHALGNVAYSRDNLDESERYYLQALSINESLGSRLNGARNQYQLALIMQHRAQVKQAGAEYQKVQKIAKEEKDLVLQAGALHQLGRLSVGERNLKSARSFANRALKLARKAEDRLTEVSTLVLLATVLALEGDLKTAEANLESAISAFKDLKAPEAASVAKLLEELQQRLNAGEVPAVIEEGSGSLNVRLEGSLLGMKGVVIDSVDVFNYRTRRDVIVEGGFSNTGLRIIDDEGFSTGKGGQDVILEGGLAGDPVGSAGDDF